MNERRTARGGFTLIEVLVVLSIIVLLGGLVGINVLHQQARAKVMKAKGDLARLKGAVELYQEQFGRLPTQRQGLKALVQKPAEAPVPEDYPEAGLLGSPRVPDDPWGQPYVYLVPGGRHMPFEIVSYGSDGEKGGAGDAADLSSNDL